MKLLGLLIVSAMAAFAAGEAVLIQNADIYPMTGTPLKGGSLLIQDGKIVDIGQKIPAPKGATVLEGKGLRVYPGWIDSGTELGLSEIGSIRETNDTGEIGDFMPQLKALSAVNPDSEHFGVVRVNGITAAIALPGGGGRGGGGGIIVGQAALLHTDGWTWEEMEINRSAAMVFEFPHCRRPRRTRNGLSRYVPERRQRRRRAPRGARSDRQTECLFRRRPQV